jgi:hypothetical protein
VLHAFLSFPVQIMKSFFLAATFAFFSLAAPGHSTIVINLTAANLTDGFGVPLPTGTLIQLVNLGADGVFNPLSLADGSTTGLDYWVSGDDSLVNVPYLQSDDSPGDFPSAAGFDLAEGNGTPGVLVRQMTFQNDILPIGTKLGIRWFPGVMAADFPNVTLLSFPLVGVPLGQFTRQENPLYEGELWVIPSNGANVHFDPLFTEDRNQGADPISAGMASIPEPTTVSLALLGTTLLLHRRRRPLAVGPLRARSASRSVHFALGPLRARSASRSVRFALGPEDRWKLAGVVRHR